MKTTGFCLWMSKSYMLFYLKEHENRLAFRGKAQGICSTTQRKSLLRKPKLMFISHCTHTQTCYIQITQDVPQILRTRTNTYQPPHLSLTQTQHTLTTHTHQHAPSSIIPTMSLGRQTHMVSHQEFCDPYATEPGVGAYTLRLNLLMNICKPVTAFTGLSFMRKHNGKDKVETGSKVLWSFLSVQCF